MENVKIALQDLEEANKIEHVLQKALERFMQLDLTTWEDRQGDLDMAYLAAEEALNLKSLHDKRQLEGN